MKKRIVSSIMCLAMLLSLLPVAAFATGEATDENTTSAVAVAAPLGVNSKLDNDRAKGYADTYDIEVTGTAPSYTVKFTATGLKSHKTSTEGGLKGYWVGVGIKVPEDATVTAGWGTYNATNAAPATNDGTIGDYKTYYFDLGPKEGTDKKAGFIAVTPKAEGSTPDATDGADTSATAEATTTVYNLDFTDVTLAEPSLELDFSSSGKAIDKNFFDRLAEIRPSSYQKPSDTWTEAGPNYDSEKDTISIIAPGLDMNKTYLITLKDDASTPNTYNVTATKADPNAGLTPPNYDSAAYRATFTGIGAKIPDFAMPTDKKTVTYTVTLSEKSDSSSKKALPLTQEIEIAQVTLDPNGGMFDLTSHKTAFADKNKDGVTNGAASNPEVWAKMSDNTANKAVFFAKTDTKLSDQLTDNVIPVPTKEGAKFVGWKVTSIGGTAQTDAETVTADAVTISNSCTITAQWEGDSIVDAVLQKTVVDATTDVATVKAEIGQPSADKKVVIKLSGTLDTLSGTYQLAYTLASGKVTEPVAVTFKAGEDGKTVGTITDLKVGDYTYTVDASDVIVVKVEMADPVVDTKAIDSISGISETDKTELTAAMQDKTAIAVDAGTKGALTGAAAGVAADALEAAKGEMVKGTTYAVEISLAVVPTGYDSTKNTMTLEIKPVLTLVPLDNDGNKDEDGTVINSNVKPEVTEPVKISVKLPATLANQQTLFVKHTKDNGKTYIYNGVVKNGVLTFTNPHGFSTFEVTTNGPVAKIDDIGYATLKDALEAAGNNAVITLMEAAKDATADVTVDADKTVTLKTEVEGGVKVTINGTPYTVTKGETVKVELKKSTGGSSSNGGGGGGGGVSSNVTIDRPTNGKVSVTPTAPSKGATVTINLTPDTGYVVGTVTVTDKDGKAVELTKVSDTKYTFTMPDGKVKVAATFTKADAPSDGFTDVPADAYYADAVKWAVEKGITNGLTATTFGPNNSCTRGQMVTFLWRAAGSPAATGTNSFSDVASGEYYYNAVLWAVEKGITNGTSATTFSPNATVNRGQTVTFLYRYAESPAATGTSSFTDVAADAFYADAVKWAVAEEITNGTSSTTFSPSSNCTRGQIVTFMYRQMAE